MNIVRKKGPLEESNADVDDYFRSVVNTEASQIWY